VSQSFRTTRQYKSRFKSLDREGELGLHQTMIRILIFTLVFLFLQNCSVLGVIQERIPKPEFTFESLSIKEITLTDITLKMDTTLENPYPVGLPKSLLDMDLLIEGTKLTHISTDLGEIQAKASKSLPFELKIKYADLVKIYQTVPGKALLDVGLTGNVKVPLPASIASVGKESVSFPFQKQREIPAVLPSVDIQNFNIKMPSKEEIASKSNTTAVATAAFSYLDGLLSKKTKKPTAKSAVSAGLSDLKIDLNTDFDLKFQNNAASELLYQGLKYDLKLGGENFLKGTPKEIINNGKESIIKVNTAFPLTQISQGLYKTIQTKTAAFDLGGSSGLKVPGIDDAINFQYNKTGKFSW